MEFTHSPENGASVPLSIIIFVSSGVNEFNFILFFGEPFAVLADEKHFFFIFFQHYCLDGSLPSLAHLETGSNPGVTHRRGRGEI